MLETTFLELMRAQVARTLPATCTIVTAARTPDGAGGWSEVWGAVAGGTVACRLDPYGGDAELAAGAAGLRYSYRLSVPHDAPLTPGCRVQIGGTVYQVQRLDTDHDWRVVRRAIVERVT